MYFGSRVVWISPGYLLAKTWRRSRSLVQFDNPVSILLSVALVRDVLYGEYLSLECAHSLTLFRLGDKRRKIL